MWLIGVILAGFILLIRPLPGLLKGMSSGVLIGKGHGSPRIERATEPERFKALMKQRTAELVPGVLMILGGAGWLVLNLLAAAAQRGG